MSQTHTDPSAEWADLMVNLRSTETLSVDPELTAQVNRLADEVERATLQLAPLLSAAMAQLVQVDQMVCNYAAAGATIDDEEARYDAAVSVSGHRRLFDALAELGARADAFSATAVHHPGGIRK